ncbi:MAG: VOC family protein [Rhodomicrobium sp.]
MPRPHTSAPATHKPAAKPAAAAKASSVAAMPEGFHTITPSLTVPDGEAAIALYEKAFGAEVLHKMHMPGSKKVVHACLQIGSSRIFVQDEMPNMPGPKQRHASFYLYVPDVDAAFKRALSAGMKELYAPSDMFWGDRTGVVADQFGNHWTFATHIRNPSEVEMTEAMKAWAGKATSH